jgi:hypothetical protein
MTQQYHPLFTRIKRPKNCSVFNQTVLICTVPAQDPAVIKEISDLGLELRITAYRPSDNKMSKTSFLFRYFRHDAYVRAPIPNARRGGSRGGPSHRRRRQQSDDYDDDDDDDDDYDEEEEYNMDDMGGGSRATNVCACCQLLGADSRQEGVQELPVAKPGVQRRIANLTEAPDDVAEPENDNNLKQQPYEVDILGRGGDINGPMMGAAAAADDSNNIPTFLMDCMKPQQTTTPPPPLLVVEEDDNMQTSVKMNFTIKSNDIVEMKIEPDVILASPHHKRPYYQHGTAASEAADLIMPLKKRMRLQENGAGSLGGSPARTSSSVKSEPMDLLDLSDGGSDGGGSCTSSSGHLTMPVPKPRQQHDPHPHLSTLLDSRSSRMDMHKSPHIASADLSKLFSVRNHGMSAPGLSTPGLSGSVTRPVLLKPRKDLTTGDR